VPESVRGRSSNAAGWKSGRAGDLAETANALCYLETPVLAYRTIIDTLSLGRFVRDGGLATPLRASRLPKHVRYLATLLPAGFVLRNQHITPAHCDCDLAYTAPIAQLEIRDVSGGPPVGTALSGPTWGPPGRHATVQTRDRVTECHVPIRPLRRASRVRRTTPRAWFHNDAGPLLTMPRRR